MNLLYLYDAKLIKLLIILFLFSSCNLKLFSKKRGAEPDPISAAVEQERSKNDAYGMKLKSDEKAKFAKIDKRTAISKKEKEVRMKQKTNQKLTIMDKYRLARANRKDYLYKKRTDRYKRKIIKRRQPKTMQDIMTKDRRRVKRRDRNKRMKQKWKSFKNLFR